MTLAGCKLKLREAAVCSGKSMLPCYVYSKKNTEKLEEEFDAISSCDYLFLLTWLFFVLDQKENKIYPQWPAHC